LSTGQSRINLKIGWWYTAKATPLSKKLRTGLKIFKASLKRIQFKNANSINATFTATKFADMSPTEFRAKILMKKILIPQVPQLSEVVEMKVQKVPEKFDWREMDVVTPVKDQGKCGSCWAFAVTENIESVWMIAKKLKGSQMPPLSPQQIVDCDKDDDGCGGGSPRTAFDYVQHVGGLEQVKDYPYRAKDEQCHFKKADVFAQITGWKYATTNHNEAKLKHNLVQESPLSICVDAEAWQDYESGVMTAKQCCHECNLDHCVQLIGYDSNATIPYYIVRNSWGTDWGMKGYILLEMGKNTCDLTSEATTAIL